jgi:hypothetical protein
MKPSDLGKSLDPSDHPCLILISESERVVVQLSGGGHRKIWWQALFRRRGENPVFELWIRTGSSRC